MLTEHEVDGRQRQSDPAFHVDTGAVQHGRYARSGACFQIRERQTHKPHRLRVVLDAGTAGQFAVEEHPRELPRVVGHLSAALAAATPRGRREVAQFDMFGEAIHEIAPPDRFCSPGELLL